LREADRISSRGPAIGHVGNRVQTHLGNQEVRVNKGGGTETSPNEEDGRSEVTLVRVDHVGGDDGDDGVPQPVGTVNEQIRVRGQRWEQRSRAEAKSFQHSRSGQGDTSRSDGQGEDLSDQDPSTRTPGRGEEEDEDGDESDLGVDGSLVLGVEKGGTVRVNADLDELVESDGDSDNGDEELTDQHSEGTDDEKRSSTESLNGVEGDGSGADVDDGEDHRGEERVVDGTGRGQEGSRVVEDEVDTGPLLHHLERSTQDGSSQVGSGVSERSRETSGPGTEPGGGGHQRSLVLGVGDNLGKLGLDQSRVLVLSTKTGQNVSSSGDVLLLDKVSRRLGEHEETETEDKTPSELDTDGDSVRSRVGSVLGKVDDDGGQHDTDGDTELVSGNEGSSDLSGTDLGHVKNDDGGDETDTNTGDDTTNDDSGETLGGEHLNHDSDKVDSATRDDSRPSSHHVGKVTSDKGTEEGTGGKDRDDQRGLGRTDLLGIGAFDGIDKDSRRQDSCETSRNSVSDAHESKT